MKRLMTIILASAMAFTGVPFATGEADTCAYAAQIEEDSESFRYHDGELLPEDEITEKGFTGDLPSAPPSAKAKSKAAFSKAYKSEAPSYSGIDVSKWQGAIDFSQYGTGVYDADGGVHAVQFVILRCGYTSGTAAKGYSYEKDPMFDTYAAACETYGIPYGVYYYSKAVNDAMLTSEVAVIKQTLTGRTVSLPVYLDMEDKSVTTALSKSDTAISAIASSYSNMMSSSGYAIGIYASTSYWYDYLETFARTDIACYHWIAQYGTYCAYGDPAAAFNGHTYQSWHRYQTWQYSSKGTASWITSDYVDLDYWYGEHILSANMDGTGIKVKCFSFNAAANNYTYTLYRSDDSAGYWSEWKELGAMSGNEYTDVFVQGGVSYKYKVVATSGATGLASESEEIGIGYNTSITGISINSVEKSGNAVAIGWGYVAAATGYYVWRRGTDADWTKIADITSSSTLTYTDNELVAGKAYTYSIQPYSTNALGDFDFNGVTVVYPTSENAAGGVQLTWGTVYGAVSFDIYRKTNSGDYEYLTTTTAVSYKDTSAGSGNCVYYRVDVNMISNVGAQYRQTGLVTAKLYYVKATRIKSAKSTRKRSFILKWAKIKSAKGYEIQYSRTKSMSDPTTVTINSYKTISRTFTSLRKKKYYIRMRCYIEKGGVKYYSVWTNVKAVKVKR